MSVFPEDEEPGLQVRLDIDACRICGKLGKEYDWSLGPYCSECLSGKSAVPWGLDSDGE